MQVSHLDVFYRRLLMTKLFTKGWGDPDILTELYELRKEICSKSTEAKLEELDSCKIHITKETAGHECTVFEGNFETPLRKTRPHLIQDEIKQAYFQMVIPKKHGDSNGHKPICIHLAGTGDHYFWRRRNLMVKPLLKHNIASIILENPYYGLRKPKNQFYSGLLNVSDVFVLGACLILEGAVLLRMCEKYGFGPLGVTGLSMGGHMASLIATYWPKPVVLVPCLSWSTASSVFTEGVLSNALKWDILQKQYFSNEKYYRILSKICRVVDNPSRMGLAHNFIGNIEDFTNKCACEQMSIYDIIENSKPVDLNLYNKNRLRKTLIRLKHRVLHENFSFRNKKDRHAIWFMRGLMDNFTHLKNYPMPADTSLIIAICAQKDGYVPRHGCMNLEELWPGCLVKYINCGHVGAFLRFLDVFRKSIIEGFEKKKCKEQKETVKMLS